MRYAFSAFRLDLQAGMLTGPEGDVRLRPKTFELLHELIRRAGQVVPKDELFAAVWGRDVHLSEDALTQAVSELRRALGDPSREPRFIETLHRRGYRFVCPVASLPAEAEALPAALPARTRARRAAVAALAGLAAVVVTGFALRPRPEGVAAQAPPHRPRVAVLDLAPRQPEAAWLGAAISDLLGSQLSRWEADGYTRERLARMAADLGLQGPVSPDQAVAVRRYLDADLVVSGTCALAGEGAQATLVIQDAGSRREVRALRGEFPLSGIGWQIESWSRDLLEAALPADGPTRRRRRLGTVSAESLRDYTTARSLLARDPAESLRLLARAEQEEPGVPRILEARVQALLALGRREEALRTARQVRSLKNGRGGEATYLRIAGQPEAALVVLAETTSPAREPEPWLEAIDALRSAGRPGPALSAIDTLRHALSGSWAESELALAEARAARDAGDTARQLRAARRAWVLAHQRGQSSTAEQARALS
jgi:DNA-binding winged helix-turn-helix (wHTH) protein